MVMDMVDVDSPTQDDRVRRFSLESYFTAEPVEDERIETPAMVKMTISTESSSGKHTAVLRYSCNASISILLTTIYNYYSKEDTDIKTREEVITLPESTHSFLFTEPVNSLPFAFGVGIAVISYTIHV